MPGEQEPSALHLKIANILGTVGNIPKGGHNSFQNYDYVEESDVLNAIRPQLAAGGIASYVDITDTDVRTGVGVSGSGTAQHLTIVRGKIRFHDATTGEWISFGIAGQGMDGGDKGLPKAITMAVKYGLMKTFLLGTGDDAEVPAEHEAPPVAPATTAPPPPPPAPTLANGVNASGDPLPWENEAEAAEAAARMVAPDPEPPALAPPRPEPVRIPGKTISDKQQRFLIAKKINAKLSDNELDEVMRHICGHNTPSLVLMDDMDALVEAIAAFGAHKAQA